MRFEVRLEFPKDQKLPFNNVYYLASTIYERMSVIDNVLSEEIHGRRGFKHFTFSWITIRDFRTVRDGIIPLSSEGSFRFTSPNDALSRSIAEGFLTKPELRIGHCMARVSGVAPLKEPSFVNGSQRFDCISPIILRIRRAVEGKEVIWDLSPRDEEFKPSLVKNLIKRYTDYYGKPPESNIFDVRIWSTKGCRLKIKDTYNRAHFLSFTANSGRQLLEFAYQAGLGERNSLGFGMIEVA